MSVCIDLRATQWLARGHWICVDSAGNPLSVDEHGKARRKRPGRSWEDAVVAAVYMHPADIAELRKLCGEVAVDVASLIGLPRQA